MILSIFLSALAPPFPPGKGDAAREAEEKDWISSAAKGDSGAFGKLVCRYQSTVRRILQAKIGNRDEVDDLSQEVFLKLWRSLPSFRGESRFSTWLYSVCSNTALDFLRSVSGKKIESLSSFENDGTYEEQTPLPDLPEDRPDEKLLFSERDRFVRAAIDSLPEPMKEVVVLRDLEGYSYAEIASMLALEEGTVKSRLNRARGAIRSFLEERNFFG